MRIACCLFKYSPYSGLARDFVKVSRELLKRGHQVTAYVLCWEGEREPGIDVRILPVPSVTNHGRIELYVEALEAEFEKNRPDVVLGFNKMPGLDVYYAADVCFEDKVRREKRGMKLALYRLTRRYRTFRRFEEAVFSPRPGEKAPFILFLDGVQMSHYAAHYRFAAERTTVVPPGLGDDFRIEKFPEERRQALREEIGVTKDELLIVQVGSDYRRKGVDRSLSAIAALPAEIRSRVRFRVIGHSDAAPFEALARTLGIEKNVTFVGAKTRTCDDIAAADLLLHPAYSENTGTVILEALALATPAVVTSNCGFAHFIERSGCGAVTETQEGFSQTEFDAKVRELLESPVKRRRASNLARAFLCTHDLHGMPAAVADIVEIH